MTDPVFTTRADLEKWAGMKTRLAWGAKAQLKALKEIKRVTLAHSHLPYEGTP